LSVYAILADDHSLFLTIINKEHGHAAKAAGVIFPSTAGFDTAKEVSLIAPDGDVSATSGETLGGVEIQNDGSWNGTWTDLPSDATGAFVINVPAASATVVRLSAK
jgi:hypothetical protein